MRYENNTCPVCGLACDDIELNVGEGDVEVLNACWMGRSKYMKYFKGKRLMKPMVGGEETSWENAIRGAARVLSDARKPLVYMGTEISTEAMYEGIQLAEHLRGYLDSCTTVCHGPTVQALQEKGMPSATLGEVRNRADYVVFWGCNPVESHPRLLSKHAVYPAGRYRAGKGERTVAVVDPRRTLTADQADLFIQVDPNRDFELLTAIEMVIDGYLVEHEVAGVKPDDIKKLAREMKEAEYCAVFVGLGLASSPGKNRNMEKAMHLVRKLNKYTRAVLLVNRGHSNVAGFNEVCTWLTGYPYAVDYSRGFPRYNPGVTSAIDLLHRREVDAMLVVASDPGAHFPRDVVEYMADIPLVTVEVSETPTTYLSDIVLPGVYDSIESGGTFYRMDGVPISLRQTMKPPFDYSTSTKDTLKQIMEELKKK
ncbi:MAG: formylmethanofuran dehydrogenase subunit B [Candidatus Altiarchaeota archaeon]|nr:formylmethanofuran dehydrogenase subunit B [Candidatus Altiarchaeota archaeon]